MKLIIPVFAVGILCGLGLSDFWTETTADTTVKPHSVSTPHGRIVGSYKVMWVEEGEKDDTKTCLYTKPAGRTTYTIAIPTGETCVTVLK